MATFNAGQMVERLEFDFTDFDGPAGVVDEPSSGTVNVFFRTMKNLLKEVKSATKTGDDVNLEELDDDALAEAVGKVNEDEVDAARYQERTLEAVAVLCGAEWVKPDMDSEPVLTGGSPDFQTLSALPYRVLQAFIQWLIEEIKPKKAAPAGKR